jgi:hypothetical protein
MRESAWFRANTLSASREPSITRQATLEQFKAFSDRAFFYTGLDYWKDDTRTEIFYFIPTKFQRL